MLSLYDLLVCTLVAYVVAHIFICKAAVMKHLLLMLPMCTNMLPVKLILFSELLENSRAVLTVRTGRGRKWWESLKIIGWLIKKYIKETPMLYMFTKPRYSKNSGEESFTNTHKCILVLLKQNSIWVVYVIWEWTAYWSDCNCGFFWHGWS